MTQKKVAGLKVPALVAKGGRESNMFSSRIWKGRVDKLKEVIDYRPAYNLDAIIQGGIDYFKK
jgi:hypothetical protein